MTTPRIRERGYHSFAPRTFADYWKPAMPVFGNRELLR